MNLADNLKRIRKDNNLSQEQLAEKLGVSRQSVSKWESNQAYPEMDKVLEICKLFNLNIDELMNQDIKEVNDNKESKLNVNKIIDDFLNYITKIIDVFTSMKIKQKIKCIIEQLFIGGFLALIMLIIGAILLSFIQDIVSILPADINYAVYQIFYDLYVIACLILGVCLLLHIFKVRYLDYYDIVKMNTEKVEGINTDNQEKTIVLKKRENIIIRDPEHSSYKFISGMLKVLLIVLKLIAVLFTIAGCFSLLALIILLVLSLKFIGTGSVFIGVFLGGIACIVINLITLKILYNFIITKKCKKKILSILFLISLFLLGSGIGFVIAGIPDFKFINDISNENFIESKNTISMSDNTFIHDFWYANIEYVETDSSVVEVVYKHSKHFYILLHENYDESIEFYLVEAYTDPFEFINAIITDINNKQIINYQKIDLKIYASKENIAILKANKKQYYEKNAEYELKLQEVIKENNRLEQRIYELERELEFYE